MSSLFDSITNMVTPELLRSLSANLGEQPDAIQKGLQTGSATLLGTLASKAQDSSFLSQITSLLSRSGNAMGAAAGGATSGGVAPAASEASASFLQMLLGGNRPAIESKIAQASGIKAASAGALLSTAAPMLMSALASRFSGGSMSPTALGSALSAELPQIRSLIPTGLPGMPALSSMASSARTAVTQEAESSGNKWLLPVLLGALVIGGLIWYFMRGGNDSVKDAAGSAMTKATDTAALATSAVGDAAKSAVATLGEFFKRKLPSGVELNIPKLGIENKLIDFIEDSSKPVDKETWFDFDRLLFATGSATLEPTSQEQLQNIANILKAYPKVHARIGGYTDNTGDKAANLKLSSERSASVMAELIKLGVDPARMDAKGYGEEHPVADNATEEGRAKNRRISMRVTEK